jgi:outer membrane protein assembly factor BamE (lipoprotein component of BamABCDE complex)
MAAVLMAAAALAHAAPGFTVQARDQQLVKAGMTQDEVRAALGTPSRRLQFPGLHTSTWTYQRPEVDIVFDVDFGSDGKVTAAGERQVPFE